MCLGCDKNCCTLRVDLTSYDLYRIMMFEGRDASEFVTLAVSQPNDTYAFRCSQGLVKIVLRQDQGACIYCHKNKPLKCSVERSKPAICLIYPFELKDGKPSLRSRILCPPANILRADMQKMSLAALKDYEWESRKYAEMVSDWNLYSGGNGTAGDFMAFALEEMNLEMAPFGPLYRSIRRMLDRFLKPRARRKQMQGPAGGRACQ